MKHKIANVCAFLICLIVSFLLCANLLNMLVLRKKVTVNFQETQQINTQLQQMMQQNEQIQALTVENTIYEQNQLEDMKGLYSNLVKQFKSDGPFPSKIESHLKDLAIKYPLKYLVLHPKMVQLLKQLSKSDSTYLERFQKEYQSLEGETKLLITEAITAFSNSLLPSQSPFKEAMMNGISYDPLETFMMKYFNQYKENYQHALTETCEIGEFILKGRRENDAE